MEKYELPLVFFTVFSQMSVGIAVLLTCKQLWRAEITSRSDWFIVGALLACASVAAVLHLAHPLRAYNSLFNLSQAWLSREILMATVYGASVAAAFLTNGSRITAILASVTGLLLVGVQGMTYAATAMAAVSGGITLIMFILTTWVMGCAFIPLLKRATGYKSGLRQGIITFIAIQVAAPLIWLTGGTVMYRTGIAWLTSPLFIVGLLCLLTAYFWPSRQNVKGIFLLVLGGVLMSRLVFFGETISLADNIGSLY